MPASHEEFPKLLLRPGDLLFNRTNSAELVGKTAVYKGNVSPCSFASCLIRVRLTDVEPDLVAAYINSSHGREWIREVVRQQVGQANVNGAKLQALEVPLPPSREQRSLVEKIEALTAKSRRAKEALDAIPTLLERFRRSVLAAAFRGDLTKDWREQNPDVEPADQLLARIRRERRTRWEQAELERLRAKGKVPKNDEWKKKYLEPERVDADGLPELPQGWCWAALGEVTDDLAYGTSAKSSDEGRVPVLRMGNLQDGEIDWADLAFTSDQAEIDKYSLPAGTVLFNRTNSPELVGKTAIYRGERPAIFVGYLIRVQHVPELTPEFVNLVLNSPFGRAWCWRVKSDGVSQSNISAGKLASFPMPLCSRAEQEAIASRSFDLLAVRRKIEGVIQRAIKDMDRLGSSVLAKAFRGELVSVNEDRFAGGQRASLQLELIPLRR